jgi:(4-(4-[2-(gamma-L-glutamylamino)ethyl]phenoxymethyl)furan-2-yl)methanamine synthase
MTAILGWDIGGANVKAALVEARPGGWRVTTVSRPFEIWKDRNALPSVLKAVAADLDPAARTAVTMTAELSDAFRTKREGVGFVLDAVAAVTQGPLAVFTTDGRFVDEEGARADPLRVAASNWMATALLVARHVPDGILVDIGSTTADIVPIQGGHVVARGRTDPERLAAGELVYTGAVRTNVAAIVSEVPFRGEPCPVAAELFAIAGDVHVLLGALGPDEYTSPTPDGRPPNAVFAAERLARVVCADVEMLTRDEIIEIGHVVSEAQIRQISAALSRVASRFPRPPAVIVTGLGTFLAERAAQASALQSRDLSTALGIDVGLAAPAVATAWLLAQEHDAHRVKS